MIISYLSKKSIRSEEFLAASIASFTPVEVAVSVFLLSSKETMSSVLLALHFTDPITTTTTRVMIATTPFIASTEALVECLGNQKQLRTYTENTKKTAVKTTLIKTAVNKILNCEDLHNLREFSQPRKCLDEAM